MDVFQSMRVFAAVAAEGSFTRGAQRVGLSIQSVSKIVKALENRLGVLLLDRNTRSVTLNETGKAYLERCLALLEELDEIESTVQQQNATLRGRIRMTAPTAFGARYLVPQLCEFMRTHPEINVDLSLADRRVSLVDEGYDLALRIGQLADSTLVARKLAPMRVVVCAAPAYLDEAGEPARPQELQGRNCVIDSNFRNERQWLFRVDGRELRVPVDGSMTANSPEAARRFALAGLGIARCPHYVVNEDVVADRLRILFPEHEAFQFGVYAVYPHRQHLSARVRMLVDHLAAAFR